MILFCRKSFISRYMLFIVLIDFITYPKRLLLLLLYS